MRSPLQRVIGRPDLLSVGLRAWAGPADRSGRQMQAPCDRRSGEPIPGRTKQPGLAGRVATGRDLHGRTLRRVRCEDKPSTVAARPVSCHLCTTCNLAQVTSACAWADDARGFMPCTPRRGQGAFEPKGRPFRAGDHHKVRSSQIWQECERRGACANASWGVCTLTQASGGGHVLQCRPKPIDERVDLALGDGEGRGDLERMTADHARGDTVT